MTTSDLLPHIPCEVCDAALRKLEDFFREDEARVIAKLMNEFPRLTREDARTLWWAAWLDATCGLGPTHGHT